MMIISKNFNLLKFGLSLILAFYTFTGFSQVNKCLTDEMMEKIYKSNSEYKKSIDQGFRDFSTQLNQNTSRSNNNFVIPVHVIIVHTPRTPVGTAENFTMSKIQSQIDALNRDFNRFNADSTKTPSVFSRGRMNISFCLAKIDPFGGPTDGVTRYATSLDFQKNELAVKEASGWSRSEYLNIWVADLPETVQGFSYIPSVSALPSEFLDGVVVNHRAFGGDGFNSNPRFSRGRTAVHEVGHYLGLRHIWGEDGCTTDDGISDTPQQDKANLGCKNHPSKSCSNEGDMFMNYMDYSDDSCANAFTALQVAYMTQILNGIRFSVISSDRAPGCSVIPPLVIVGTNKISPTCFGANTGRIEILANGGKKPLKYIINGIPSDTSVITGLRAGDYKIKVIDADGNMDSIQTLLFQPDKIILSLDKIDYLGCADSSSMINIKVSAIGGISVFGYNFLINGENTNRLGLFNNVRPGKYTISSVDNVQCRDTLVVNIANRKFLKSIPDVLIQPSCNGKTDAFYSVTIDTRDLKYSYDLNGVPSGIGFYEDLKPGLYTLTVRDTIGCIMQKKFNVVNPPIIKIDTIRLSPMPCFPPDTSKIDIQVSGGTPPYMYSIGSGFMNNSVFRGVGTGRFFVEARDSRNCLIKSVIPASISQVGGMLFDVATMPAACDNNNSGTIVMIASGGTGRYNYYTNGNRSDSVLTKMKPGLYQLTLEDRVTFCQQTKNVTIGILPKMVVKVDTVIRRPNNKLQVSFKVDGGKPPYQYSINGGASTKSVAIFDDLTEGNIVITVLDANDCRVDMPIFVSNSKLLEEDKFIIYPNPFSDEIMIQLEKGGKMPKIDLFDLKGAKISKSLYQEVRNNDGISINGLSDLKSGLYIMSLTTENFQKYYKLMKL
jgi:hypothetical protein